MSELNYDSLFEATIIEYDNGNQDVLDSKMFTTESEAKNFCSTFNSNRNDSSECYFCASYQKLNR